jgi:hypothetical protein
MFSCFTLPDMFSAVLTVSGPVFKFCAPGHVFSGTEGVGYHFHVSRALTRFRRKRGCRVPFSCFALSESFPAVPRGSCPVFKFCAPGLVFCGTEGVHYYFHVLLSRTRFRRYQRRPVLFSCFALPAMFSTVPRASGPVFMFCAPGHVFDCTEGVESHFHVLRARTHFRRYRGHLVLFSCVAGPDSFSTVPRVLGPIFMFCAPGLVFGIIEGFGSRFVVLLARTHFRRYRGHRVPFSCFALLDLLSMVPRAFVPIFMFCAARLVFMFCALGLVFGVMDGVGSRFLFFASSDSFSAVPRISGPVFMFCALGVVSRGTEGVGSRLHVLRSRTHFQRYRGRRLPF